MHVVGLTRTHVFLPEDLLSQIDELVGPRGRSAFLAQTAADELRRRNLLAFLEDDLDAWKDESHPELAEGTSAWVRKLRRESDERQLPASKEASSD